MADLPIPLGQSLNRCDCYTLKGNIPGSTVITGDVTFRIGESVATGLQLGTVTSGDGAFSFDFDYPATGGDDFDTLYLSDGIGTFNLITDLEIVLQSACANTYCSEVYELSDCGVANQCDLPQVPTNGLLIQWTNDDNGLGFNYAQLGFIQQLRVKGGLRASSGSYGDETFYTTSGGQRGLQYTHTTKQEEVWVQSIPEYLHDALRVALAHDHLFINGEEYVKTEGGYAPDWDVPNTLLAGVVIPVEKKTQNTFNINC